MQDDWGDGWNGASIDVSINGTNVVNWELNNGAAGTDSIVTMNGDFIEFTFNSGNWDSEITFQIDDPLGNQIGNFGPFANNNGNSGLILSDTSNSTCVAQIVNVTFQVDMGQVTSSYTTPEVNGDWNLACGNCYPMSDTNGDDIWEVTIPIMSGYYDYIFSADSLSLQEVLDPNASCTNGNTINTKRTLMVGTADITIPLVCWESCITCFYSPQPPTGITCSTGSSGLILSDDCENEGNWTGDLVSTYTTGYWNVNSGDTPSGDTGPDNSYSGNNYFYFEASAGGLDTATIITPMIDLSNAQYESELTFWIFAYGASIGTLDVGASTNPNGPFTTLYSNTGQIQTETDPWGQIGVDLSNYVGQNIYVSFTYSKDPNANPYWEADLAIDLIEVTSCVTCPAPIVPITTNITSTSAEISWTPTGTETEWIVYVDGVGTITNAIPTTITGLTPYTQYDYQISAICSSGDTSFVSPSNVFTTLCGTNLAPTNENFDSIFSPCWSQENTLDDFDWTLNDGDTPSNDTGPDDDVSIGGNYMYTEASNPREYGDVAIMYSEQIDISNLNNPQINFFTHMYGSAMGTLQIDMYDNGYSTVFLKSGDQGDQWIEENVLISPNSNIIEFRIIGTLDSNANGDTWPGDIAIDEFSVKEALMNDLEVLSGNVNSGCELTNNEPVSVVLVNKATTPQSNFDIAYSINNAPQIIESYTSTLNPGDTATYTFTATADMSNDGVYNIDFECSLTNDQDLSNNYYTVFEENYLTPSAPTTIDDTICKGDTTFLDAITNEGLVLWYNDSNATSIIPHGMVSPTTTTTYYAAVKDAESFTDDFESYNTGAYISQSSSNWSTWSGGGGTPDDAFISTSQASSGNQSLYLNYINDDDIIMPFGQEFNSGTFELYMDIYVVTSAHLNFQGSTTLGAIQAFELNFDNNGTFYFDIGPTSLIGSYPGPGTWFKLKLEGDLNSTIWKTYIDGSFQGGAAINDGDVIASINLAPESGGEFYIDNVEWYAVSQDACIGPTASVILNIIDCTYSFDSTDDLLILYPNPSNGYVIIENNLNDEKLTIEINNIEGKLIYSKQIINSSKLEMNLSHLNKGLYTISIMTENSIKHKTIVIQ